MRVTKDIVKIDYNETKEFFNNRSLKYNEENPYSTTMYQDNNKELVKKRNEAEQKKIIPLLELDEKAKVLDIACGIGRWADAITEPIEQYCGIDFSDELIKIAEKRNKKDNFVYAVGSTNDIPKVMEEKKWEKFNRIIMAGIMMYLNEEDFAYIVKLLPKICEKEAIIYIREPMGIENRLTLKDFYSEELQSDYNAIYRTREEYRTALNEQVISEGFEILKEGFVFDEDMNNRKETAQYFFVLKRK